MEVIIMTRKCIIKTLSGAYVGGYGFLTSNRKEAFVFDNFRTAVSVVSGFDKEDVGSNMYFWPIEEVAFDEEELMRIYNSI